MVKKLQKNNNGFTIIEVLIVLAIAALIMLIVFLAIPALQRNQRNTSRRNDVGRVGAITTEFLTNNNGRIPEADDAATLAESAGTLNQYTGDYITVTDDVTATNGEVVEEMTVVTGAACGDEQGTAMDGANGRSMVILYTIEGGGAPQDVCQEI